MSGNDYKDNSNFEFIKEQVIERKRRKLRKRLMPVIITILLAILFGLIASVTFVFAEPKLYKLLNKDEETKTPFSFPTLSPEAGDSSTNGDSDTVNSSVTSQTDDSDTNNPSQEDNTATEAVPTPTPVVIEQTIAANVDDLTAMYDEMRKLSYETKSLVNVVSTFNVTDWLFGASDEQSVSTTGLIVTSNEMNYLILVSLDRVKDANSIRIKFTDTIFVDATIQDYETELNIALLSVATEDIPQSYRLGLQAAAIGESNTLTVGSPVIALGNPNGYMDSMEVGMITSRGGYAKITDNRMDLISTDLDYNKNSDGIIINLKGKVVGWITRTVTDEKQEGLSNVIGISKLIPIINQMANQEPRIYFGIIADDMTTEVKQEHNIINGIFVSDVQDDSPAFEAGLKKGDFILSINDQAIQSTNKFYSTITTFKAEDEIIVKIQRTSGTTPKELELTVTLANKVQ